jgi:hypothetical protein
MTTIGGLVGLGMQPPVSERCSSTGSVPAHQTDFVRVRGKPRRKGPCLIVRLAVAGTRDRAIRGSPMSRDTTLKLQLLHCTEGAGRIRCGNRRMLRVRVSRSPTSDRAPLRRLPHNRCHSNCESQAAVLLTSDSHGGVLRDLAARVPGAYHLFRWRSSAMKVLP